MQHVDIPKHAAVHHAHVNFKQGNKMSLRHRFHDHNTPVMDKNLTFIITFCLVFAEDSFVGGACVFRFIAGKESEIGQAEFTLYKPAHKIICWIYLHERQQ